ncbi:methyltetrahydrofolate--corrinoid iron-sulfur protein Co-methyltransferase [Desulfacinum infernum DSM 9756]|jgi:5-methyltetrahydrofolate corrinoid/iron sulfur protein methyltransferase|uniref:Methyltetrahydrofolate--corrinoid iron-sulfur protein Co-methyltransferase n=1 Tax=Desulfacinum infernum DSM 9756 TaxID=1121391 RepID=A0A1M5I8D0_9BACT|nr:dihydropteroate synthase [Desulfacinum infernum]MBZ4660282.1 dihydropteroate synthase [Desulfacinum sp.]SHG24526.1 methyltetrahydrofolate--corrinoid iron-sulfur protein Co-methyltransferase [Desulfacinum infernum DSM 9756]
MKLIGENLNIMSKKYGKALKERDAKTLQELAVQEAEAGMDYIDLNIGPAGKTGEELMSWLVPVIHEVVDLPLALDTSNIKAIEAGLKAHKKGRAMINSIMVRPERMDALLPLAKEYDAEFIGLLWGPEGMPRDENERGALCAELLFRASEMGIPPERIYIDPIQTPVNVQQNQIMSALNFMKMFPDMAPGCSSTIGLSNVSNGAPEHLRPILNQVMLILWKRWGMQSAIVDTFDYELHKIARGERPELEALVAKVEDGEEIDMASLTKEEQDFVKTARVILGHTLYSDSWLEV